MSLTKTFTDTSTPGPSGPIVSWLWDFGDSNTSTAQNPIHTYASAGTYSVSLTVTGSGSDGTSTTIMSVVALDTAAINAAFSYSISGLAVTFSDLSTPGPNGPITAWSWDFGDGNTSTSQNPSHTYASAGSYVVTLTVTGTSPDGTDSSTHTLTVTSAGTSFISVTSWARPSFTPTRTIGFTTKAELDAAVANMAAGDYIHYTGTGVLNISSSSGTVYKIAKNPSSDVVFDFGTAHSLWAPGNISPNYVKFSYTGTGNFSAFWINGSSNIRFYGGYLTTGNYGGTALLINAPSHDILWYDLYCNLVGGSGVSVRGSTSAGAASAVSNLDIRAEVARWSMNPSWDTHADKGTGNHGCILHGSSGDITNSRFVFYGSNPLQPGETSAGKTWSEGGGGCVIEPGNDQGNNSNLTIYAYGTNMHMHPVSQTGGNVINIWGPKPLNGMVIGWAEGNDISGAVVHGDSSTWWTANPKIICQHGRDHNVNQWTGGGNASYKYVNSGKITYQDNQSY